MTHFGYYTVDLFDCPPFQMFSNGDDPRAADILENRRFEPHSMKLWCRYAGMATAILDVGAHTGVYALAAASLRKDIPIHAFEPNPFTAARLRVHKHLNRFEHLVDHPLALGDDEGITEISWNEKPGGHLSSGATFSATTHWVKAPAYVYRLDSIQIEYGTLPLMKIDVEGYELRAVRGMSKLLAARPIIILESFSEKNCNLITQMLAGYHVFKIHEDGGLEPQEKLLPANSSGDSLNQLLLPSLALL